MNLPTDLPAMLDALVAEHYNVSFALDSSGRARCLVDLTGPLGSQATGLGDTPAAALASVWPLGDLDDDTDLGDGGQYALERVADGWLAAGWLGDDTGDGQDDDVMDGPAVAAIARQATVLGDYVAGVLASGGQLASHRHALEHVGGELASLGALLAADPEAVEAGAGDELEPYCRTCGHWIGYFLGLDGWQHYRGEPARGGRRTLYDAGHEADPAWCVPPGRSLAPADLAVVRDALADGHASQWHRGEPGAAERADAYSALLSRLAAEAADR